MWSHLTLQYEALIQTMANQTKACLARLYYVV